MEFSNSKQKKTWVSHKLRSTKVIEDFPAVIVVSRTLTHLWRLHRNTDDSHLKEVIEWLHICKKICRKQNHSLQLDIKRHKSNGTIIKKKSLCINFFHLFCPRMSFVRSLKLKNEFVWNYTYFFVWHFLSSVSNIMQQLKLIKVIWNCSFIATKRKSFCCRCFAYLWACYDDVNGFLRFLIRFF